MTIDPSKLRPAEMKNGPSAGKIGQAQIVVRGRSVKDCHRTCIILCTGLLVLAASWISGATDSFPERSLQIDGKISDDGTRVELQWAKSSGKKIGRIKIQRRILGETGRDSWMSIASVRSFSRLYSDDTVRPGVAYEYRVTRPSQEQIETGYWATGRYLAAEENRGVAIVLVDETLAGDLATRLDRFMQDLIGDGWSVVRRDTPRGIDKDPVANLKEARKLSAWIRRLYHSNPAVSHALMLVGHVPVVKSGRANPDGHKRRPLETDLFYADMDGIWSDNGQGILLHNAIPSDHIEMQIGRIDFAHLDGALGDEIGLLRNYFDKNHLWRHGRLGDLRRAYGQNSLLFVETAALRNIVGPDAVTTGGHHDAGTRQPWLFGVDFGKSNYEHYINKKSPIKAVFSINFGSGKLDFSNRNNSMSVMLAQAGYTLTTGWGGRPAWQLHHMAMGKSIGYSHMRTVNNGTLTLGGPETLEYTPTGVYTWLNPPWVNLLGDPTLHPFPLASVANLRAEMRDGSVHLDWAPANTATQEKYRVYRAPGRFGPYLALNPDALQTTNQFVDPDPLPGAWYMVRAHALKEVYAGSFNTFSQGRFVSVD